MFNIIKIISWLQKQVRDQFGFSKAETNGTIILLGLIFCFLTLPYGIKWYYKKSNPPNNEADIALLDSILLSLKQQQSIKDTAALPKKNYKNAKKDIGNIPITSFDINTASTQELERLPGIGTVRSGRIVKYRDKLGGFVQLEQYQEIYGLDASSMASMLKYTYIKQDFIPNKININQSDFKAILAHPYLSYEQVKRIVQLRTKRGSFKNIEELLELDALEKETFEKIKHYLTV